MFSKVDLTLQDKSVTSSSQHYANKSYLEKLLGNGESAKKTYARTSGWLRDSDFPKPEPTRAEAMKEKKVNELIDQYPCIPYQPDFEKGLCTTEYFDLYRSLNQLSAKPNLDVTLAEKNGYTIHGMNFAADSSDRL